MAADKFYVINKSGVVENVIVCTEEYAAQNKLIRLPVMTEFGMADIGWQYLNGEFLPPPRDILAEWDVVRQHQAALLAESDGYVMPDLWDSYTPEQKEAWSNYRQALRVVLDGVIDPRDVVFPAKPA